ncbi:MAG: hypothetical protein HC880_18935 [Bacteroidia bacterium]|nr:hypothetical protein [Bacteroidia bacterium]
MPLFLAFTTTAQQVFYSAYTEDRDGDGVPNVRDKCPDTDKNLDGQELKVEVDGKEMYVKIADLKGNFENRRRKLLVEISRMDKERNKLMDPIKRDRSKLNKLSPEDQAHISELDSIIDVKRDKLANLVYEAHLNINGQEKIVEVEIGVDEFGCLPDRDRDDVPDMVDKCPDDPGVPRYFGCNDRDGDTVLDPVDDCPDEPGLVKLKGCPDNGTGDRDKDGTIDRDDICPEVPGPKSNKGCPEIVNEQEKP